MASVFVRLHLLKVLLPAQLAQLNSLLLHVLCAGLFGVGLHLALDGWLEGSDDAGSEESGVDAVVDSDGSNGDACNKQLDIVQSRTHQEINLPRGICTMLYKLSTPSSELPFTGTPITGRAVWAAAIPGR